VAERGIVAIRYWFQNEYPQLVAEQRSRIQNACEPFEADFPMFYLSVRARLADGGAERIGATVDLATLNHVDRMGSFALHTHVGQNSEVDVEDKVLFGRIYGWVALTPDFQAPKGMYAKDLIAIRLENWLDADDARFVHSLTKQQLFETVAYADAQTIEAFVDLAAVRVVAELWGKSKKEMVEWLPF